MQIVEIKPVELEAPYLYCGNPVITGILNYITIHYEGQTYYIELQREYSLLETCTREDLEEIAERVSAADRERNATRNKLQQMNSTLIDIVYNSKED